MKGTFCFSKASLHPASNILKHLEVGKVRWMYWLFLFDFHLCSVRWLWFAHARPGSGSKFSAQSFSITEQLCDILAQGIWCLEILMFFLNDVPRDNTEELGMIFASILVLGPDVYQLMKSIILSDYLCTFVPLPQRVTRKRLFPFVGAYVCQSYVSNPSCDTFIQNLPVQTSIHHSLSTPFESTHPRDTVAPLNTKLLPTSFPPF